MTRPTLTAAWRRSHPLPSTEQLADIVRPSSDRVWVRDAVRAINADFNRSADTHLIRLDAPEFADIDIYLKDESTHPSGSLKHRLARSLFLYGLCNGWILPGRPVIEASSGSTAVSEAYFARLIGVPFIALVPEKTAPAKIGAIRAYGGEVRTVSCASEVVPACRRFAAESGGVFLDQFTHAERATDWRGNNNIAESLFGQLALERHATPSWVVVGAGTGGTSATIGRFIRYTPALAATTRLCVVDPDGSALLPHYRGDGAPPPAPFSGVVEGIGRPDVPPSFMPSVIDRMIGVPDAVSLAAMLWLERRLGRRCGPSTGTNLVGALMLAREMRAGGQSGSIVTLICDAGERYASTAYDPVWRNTAGLTAERMQSADLFMAGLLDAQDR